MALFSPFIPLGHNYYLFLYYYSFSIHSRDHLASILNVTVGFLSLLYLVLFSFGFKNLHETFEILETLCTQLSQLSHFSHTYFEPYYVLIIPYFCPVPNFSLFLFCFTCSFFASKGNNPLTLACIFFIYLVSFLPKTSFKKDTTPVSFCPHPCALYFVLLSFSFSLSCTYTYTHKKRQLRL